MTLRIAAAQLNFWVGDVEGNAARIITAANDARDRLRADIVVFPELSLLGYPPDDLLQRSGLPAVVAAALQKIGREVLGIHVIVGHPEYADEGIYNAATVFRDRRAVAHYRKQLLPNYGVFDEKRYFLPGKSPCVFEINRVPVGVCICEDVWGPNPAAQSRRAGAELLININASPYTIDKALERSEVLCARAAETGIPILYVNLVGGQDDLLFDGDSIGINGDGTIGFRAPQFEENLYLVEYDLDQLRGEVRPDESEDAIVYRGLTQSIRDYVNRNGFKGALIGMSGGVDSALVAALASDALGSERVWGVAMPSRYTADMSNEDAYDEAQRLGLRFDTIAIEPMFRSFVDSLAPLFKGKAPDITEENLQARCRGVLLMSLSNKHGYIVLTTGNKSEMAVGYATLYGDMAGGFAPIKDVYKTLVYRLARWRNGLGAAPPSMAESGLNWSRRNLAPIPERVLTRAPSAELRPDQTDQDSLPPYDVLDAILRAYVEEQRSISEIVASGYAEDTVRRVASLVRKAEYKRRQAPPGPKITERAFGRDRRYPITAVYGDV
ncbi:MAG TPA: NAD+ synthase [Verrucomicrobiae bacterium]|nr:NAD+ synthase [Verrucomicrobiae bacterium]